MISITDVLLGGDSLLSIALKTFCDKPGRGIAQAYLMRSVAPVPGCVVCCDLAGVFEHSGIYVGRGRIVHRDGEGFLAAVDPATFLERLSGKNPAKTIFVSCKDGAPVGGAQIARRARLALKDSEFSRGYNILTNNCHQFCRYCVTGTANRRGATFETLEKFLKKTLGVNGWRAMER